jgi:hypothetical protein
MLLAERSPSDVGAAEDLQAMADRHELDAIERSVDKAEASLAVADRSLKTARWIAASDPDSALLLAWDGVAFQALAATLAMAGYRVTSQVGHHRVAVEAGRLLLGDEALLSRIGRLMRTRGRGMYEAEPAEVGEVTAALDDCDKLIRHVRSALERARAAK